MKHLSAVTANGLISWWYSTAPKTSEINHPQFASGPITLQHGAGVIKFRKVQMKPL